MNAKSLCGSHISLTLLGRYPPTPPTKLLPILYDLLLSELEAVCSEPRGGDEPGTAALGASDNVGDLSPSMGDAGVSTPSGLPPFPGNTRRYMWMVEESEETARSVPVKLKFMLHILADELPLLNCHNFLASGTEYTLTTVPLSEAVASIVPVELSAKHAMGDLCAWMTLRAEREIVSKRRTSPVVGAGGGPGIDNEDGEGGVEELAEGEG